MQTIAARATGFLVVALCALTPTQAAPQQPASQSAPVLTEEVMLIYNGWALLAKSDAASVAAAVAHARDVLQKYPRSIAAASLLVEAEIARGGGLAGLSAYESWIGSRPLEDVFLLRRAARAVLWADTAKPEVAVEALRYLADDDDVDALAQLVRRMMTANGLAETKALARRGDENAIRRLIQQLDARNGPVAALIESLVESRSKLAVAPLTKILGDANHPEFIALAAEGLGRLNATEAIPQLRRLYQDQSQLGMVRFMAAAGLLKLNDPTGLPLLTERLASEEANVRRGAATMMATQPDGNWLGVVRGLTADKDASVRAEAARLIAPYDLELARRTLEQLLIDANPAIRELAGKTMVERVANDFATLRRLIRSSDAMTQVAAAGRILELSR